MGLISRVSSRTYRGLPDMEDSDDIDSFLNFARDLVELIPVNVQTTHKQKTKGQKSKQTGQNSPQKGSKLKAPATTRASTGNELIASPNPTFSVQKRASAEKSVQRGRNRSSRGKEIVEACSEKAETAADDR